jgi:hypothetical protein
MSNKIIHPVTLNNKKQFSPLIMIIQKSGHNPFLTFSGLLDVWGLAEGDATIAGCDSWLSVVYIAEPGILFFLE